ncbi:hypothetical protein [Marinitoga sp. 1138]|uniref:hypothetical protein n=1 Tax=Marinitoga sp. 1138 TaxID=1643334 RepID=UPI001585FA22|nr:hypothetical protein [Marinitoga sp. 1138]NUU96720.1 hypothetical protein [Marinitoga sp. 1138]
MGMGILFRLDPNYSLFREYINSILKNLGNISKKNVKVYFGTGYIQYNKYYDILSDGLEDAINIAIQTNKNIKFIFVSDTTDKDWKQCYKNFENAIRKQFSNFSNNFNFYTTNSQKNMKWHAKIFLVTICNTPQIALIGSSNLTRPAYSYRGNNENSIKYNIETDTIIWRNEKQLNFVMYNIRDEIEKKIEKIPPIIFGVDKNSEYTVGTALKDLKNEIDKAIKNGKLTDLN